MTTRYETKSDRIRAQILSGKTVHPPSLSVAEGATGSLGSVVLGDLKILGYRFDRFVDGETGLAMFRCVNPDYEVTESDRRRLRESKNPSPSTVRAAKARVEQRPLISSQDHEVAPPGETAHQRKLRLDRLYKTRIRERRRAEKARASGNGLARVTTSAPVPAPAPEVPTQTALDAYTSHGNFDTFNGVGIIGVEGFGRDELLNYMTKLDGQPPTLGQGLQVFAMALLDNGVMRVGVQSGERRWVADVVAEIER